MPMPSKPSEIAIIGAGYSGTLVAAHLLKESKAPLTVRLFDRDPKQFGRGIAYATPLDCQLLNVPAGNMSAFPDDPGHFLRWAKEREAQLLNPPWVVEIGPKSFLPRRAYGDYLAWVLAEAERAAAPGVTLVRRAEKVAKLSPEPNGEIKLVLAGGQVFRVDRAVLALGNFPPGNLPIPDPNFYRSPRYHRNPWLPGVLEQILETRSCLLVGSGLTMVDWAVSLGQYGYTGQVHVVSRRGFWPKAHQAADPVGFALDLETGDPSVRAWLRQIRAYVAKTGCDWRAVIDALRPHNQHLWQSLPLAEKRRFMRHARPFWDLHRHRLAPGVAARLEAIAESGQLVRHAGRVQGYRETETGVEVTIRPRGVERAETLEVEAVVNCSGSESNYRRLESALVRNLLGQGLIRPDPLSLGIEVAMDGGLVDAHGVISDRLFTLGPPSKGMLWETTAVPELRVQAQRLAGLLLAG